MITKTNNTPAPATAQTEVTTRGNQQRDLIEYDEGWTPKSDAPTPTQGEHTPLPWLCADSDMDLDGDSCVELYSGNGDNVRVHAYVPDYDAQGEIDADFILKAVNNHDKLVDFVKYVQKFYQANFDVMPVAFQTVDSEAEQLLEDLNG